MGLQNARPNSSTTKSQAAYLQGNGSFHESFSVGSTLTGVKLTFWDEQRALVPATPYESILATVTGPGGFNVSQLYTPTNTSQFLQQTLLLGTLAPGTYTITFAGDPVRAPSTAFVDDVKVAGNYAPEPASLLVWALAIAAGVVGVRQARTRNQFTAAAVDQQRRFEIQPPQSPGGFFMRLAGWNRRRPASRSARLCRRTIRDILA